ncbi:hypothetical protein KPL76_01960 [Subtercola sp. PAMC28395]|uniref:hypothetical protein n=1 Tax=Subtercola sp. PAMC28395 TaxID=2846775 RepID=UPI001C0DB48D|nr:hypothetical protein [Subtercola sp. PAMC28395]QWT24217.1 hypothetical protein KPL76_01960 [Subtercola sp. PAMC28395]
MTPGDDPDFMHDFTVPQDADLVSEPTPKGTPADGDTDARTDDLDDNPVGNGGS